MMLLSLFGFLAIVCISFLHSDEYKYIVSLIFGDEADGTYTRLRFLSEYVHIIISLLEVFLLSQLIRTSWFRSIIVFIVLLWRRLKFSLT